MHNHNSSSYEDAAASSFSALILAIKASLVFCSELAYAAAAFHEQAMPWSVNLRAECLNCHLLKLLLSGRK